MNYWLDQSIKFANQRNYLDELYKVYPIVPNIRRELTHEQEERIEALFDERDNKELIKELLKLELFPLKDSYIPYLRKDPTALERNPKTVNRIASTLYDMGIDEIFKKATEPKETNRQMGPMFKNWIDRGFLGFKVFHNVDEFMRNEEDGILNVSDAEQKIFAQRYLEYNREKGLDFVARINNKYILAEAKFLTDYGGHQNAQLSDAINTLDECKRISDGRTDIIPLAIIDGVVFIKGDNKMYRQLLERNEDNIVSSLVLREFLNSL